MYNVKNKSSPDTVIYHTRNTTTVTHFLSVWIRLDEIYLSLLSPRKWDTGDKYGIAIWCTATILKVGRLNTVVSKVYFNTILADYWKNSASVATKFSRNIILLPKFLYFEGFRQWKMIHEKYILFPLKNKMAVCSSLIKFAPKFLQNIRCSFFIFSFHFVFRKGKANVKETHSVLYNYTGFTRSRRSTDTLVRG